MCFYLVCSCIVFLGYGFWEVLICESERERSQSGDDDDAALCDLFPFYFQDDSCPANGNSPSCDDPVGETICQLTCNRASDECVQADEEKCGKIGVDVSAETWTDMFSTRCKEICETSRDAESPEKVCRFYKVSVSSLKVPFQLFM